MALFALAPPPRVQACTTFELQRGEDLVVGKSYDWRDGRGVVLVNRRGVAKVAVPNAPSDRPARWASRYASVTFNQYGREMPNGGMNEAGLVVEIMWLEVARFPAADDRPMVNELQWIQYQLDRFSTVAEVVAHAPKLRLARRYARVHYLACDATGACAAFEPIDGRLVVTAGDALKVPALTNHPYAVAAARLQGQRGFGGDAEPPSGAGSLARFARAAAATALPPRGPVRAAAFALLDDVSMGDYSKWNIVYEPRARRVHFRRAGAAAIGTLDLDDVDGSCAAPVVGLDLAAAAGGDLAPRLRPWTTADNARLVAATLGALGLGSELAGALARYPETTRCEATTP